VAVKPPVKYRADIDGLRAVAVLQVLAYHVGIYRLRGGFVGVDVFFVISGFLISSIIFSDLDSSRFSLVAFYERRIRRIFPALVVMLLGTAVLAYVYCLPTEFVAFGKSLLAATFSVSNVLFLHQSGYFDAPAKMKPLLHTWSLGVEEQFYVFLPLFLMVVRRFFVKRQVLLVSVVAGLSFAVSAEGAFRSHDATFYLAPTRAWELLLGTLLAMNVFPGIASALWRNLTSFLGVVLVLAAGVAFNSSTPFPGAAALLPCLGAALIIAAGKSGTSIAGRALSWRPVAFIGMISYSLYLWHWPLIVFQGANGLLVKGLTPNGTKIVLILVSIVIATLSWWLVEQPFRGRGFPLSRAAIFRLASVAAVVLLFLGAGILASGGMPSRYPAEAVKVASYLENTDTATDAEYRTGTCFLTSKNSYQDFNPAVCLQQDRRKPNDLLVGDSHAAQLWHGLASTFTDVNLMQATASGCKPTLDQSHSGEPKCSRLMNYVFSDYLPTHHVDLLIIAARWNHADLGPLQQTLEWANRSGIDVLLFGPIVQYDSALPRLLAMSIKANDPAIPALHRVAAYESLDGEMSKLAQSERDVRYVSYFKMLCRQSSCLEYAGNGVPLQSDYGHLTAVGSLLVATKLRESGILN
jgi:peptidoglycan/LPS O-acetylase OafA/YrhL